ncbi:MAG: hypothetical protein Q8L48_31630 [Archangium sp.]|nr:hypothetical protein [Archangium sp.]
MSMLAGMLSELARGDVPPGDVLGALVLSPLLIFVGGGMVAPEGWRDVFVVAGILFCPVYAGLAFLWLRHGNRWLWLAIGPWTALGYYGLFTKLAGVMSV